MTDDQRPRGSCVIPGCPRDPYPDDAGRPRYVCGPCTSRLRHWLIEIPGLCVELQAKDAPESVAVHPDVRERVLARGGTDTVTVELVAVEALTVASALPAGSTPGAARGGRVSGSPEPRSPSNEDALDLLAAPRSLRRALGPDDIGFLPVASTLDFWVQDLRDHRGRGEGLPEPSVTVLCGWLLDRIDDACDDYPPVDEMFDQIRLAYGALRGQLGIIDVPQYMKGVPCPRCSLLTLLHKDGSKWIECSQCPTLLTFDEYERHVKTVSTEEKAKRRDLRLLRRLLAALHAVGWRHTVEHAAGADPATGAPEPYRIHRWRRGVETIELEVFDGSPAAWTTACWYIGPDDRSNVGPSVTAGGWLGIARLTRVAAAAGVLALPKEQAA